MHVNPRASSRRASLVAVIWSILLLLQRLPSLAVAAATGSRASPNDGSGAGQTGGDESASATGAAERSQQQQQLGRRTARMRRFITRARLMAPVMVTSSTGYNLAINDDGDVYGVTSDNSPYVRMKVVTIDAGLVALQGVETGLYIGVNDEGSIIATQSITENNYLIETLEPNLFTTYKWYKHHLLHWYLAINRKGRLPRYRPARHHGNPPAVTTADDRTIKQSEMFLVRPIR